MRRRRKRGKTGAHSVLSRVSGSGARYLIRLKTGGSQGVRVAVAGAARGNGPPKR